MSDLVGRVRRTRARISSAREQNGIRGASREMLRIARRIVELPFVTAAEAVTDARLGVRTRGALHNERTVAGRSVGGDPESYQPVRTRYWRQLISAIPLDPGASTFVDLGAGRGRAMLLAADHGFLRIVGIELDDDLAAEAEANVRSWARRRQEVTRPEFSVIHGDAAQFLPPDGPLVLFLFNPFGSETLRRVLARLCARPPHPGNVAYIAYCHPVHADILDTFPELTEHSRGRNWSIHRVGPAPSSAEQLHAW